MLNLSYQNYDSTILNKAISYNIKHYRLCNGMSQLDLASSMGFSSPSFFCNAEANRNNKHFNIEHILIISTILKVDIHNLIPSSKELELFVKKFDNEKESLGQ